MLVACSQCNVVVKNIEKYQGKTNTNPVLYEVHWGTPSFSLMYPHRLWQRYKEKAVEDKLSTLEEEYSLCNK